ncbi:MAG TPA: hypothetical protein VK988_09695 [Acidimicrobiales bacterium]|nr:hypothetical protein [Acidimicrobiales bacterium]
MRNSVELYASRSLRRSTVKHFRRVVDDLQTDVSLEMAIIDAAADLQCRRTGALGRVARAGMHEVAIVSKVETCLATMVPLASGRLAAIGDMAALSIAEVVNDTERQVR